MKENNSIFVVDKEATLDINELFFSITDKESRILSGNDVFVRISGYTKSELVGSFHNIIRHPDMPKVIFKTLWDYLKADKPIVAYVKNRTKEGGYYWVLAAVFALNDRYVSIRLKPSTKIFTAVKELYTKLLMVESLEGVEGSAVMLSALLRDLGYKNYDHFMGDALLQELQGHKGLHSQTSLKEGVLESSSPLLLHLKLAYGYTQTLMSEYNHWFEKINVFTQTKSMFEEKSLLLREVAREIVFLSLNASVSSYKIARGGETFSVLARDIRTNAKENDSLIGQIDIITHNLSDSLNGIIFSVSGIRLQTEMLTYFIAEQLSENASVHAEGISNSMEILFKLIAEYSGKLNTLQIQIEQHLYETLKYLDQLEQQMMYLGYIQVYGIIEAAGYRNETVSFEGIFSQLKVLIQTTSGEITSMRKMTGHFCADNRHLINNSVVTDNIVAQLGMVIMDIKKLENS